MTTVRDRPAIDVVAGVIQRGPRFLVCQRAADKPHGGLYEFPGGKLLPGESLKEAIERELREKLGVEVKSVGALLASISDPGNVFVIHFVRVTIDGEPQAHEHQSARWLTPEEIRMLPLAPSNGAFMMHFTVDPRHA